MALEPVTVDRHPTRIELEDWWFAQQPQPPGAPTVERAAADLLEIGEHVHGCGHCSDALAGLEDERRAFLDAHPLDDLLGDVVVSAPVRRLPWLVALAAVLALGFFLGTWATGTQDDPLAEPGLRAKGGAILQITDAQGAPTVAAAGDVVRFSVHLETAGYPLLVVVQEDGALSVAYPVDLAAQRLIPADEALLLPGAAALDDYAGREEVRMYVAESPWTRDAIADVDGQDPSATAVLREAR